MDFPIKHFTKGWFRFYPPHESLNFSDLILPDSFKCSKNFAIHKAISLEPPWTIISSYVATCKAVLGQKKYQHCEWITEKSLQLVKIRKKRKAALKSGRTQTERSYQLKRIWRLSVDAQPRRRSITQLDSKEVERMQDQTTYQRKLLRLV